jgi:hypothetical protein
MALLFNSQSTALAAIDLINTAMGLGPSNGDVTLTWAVPREDAAGRWVVAKPEDRFLTGVTGYSEGSPQWPTEE